MTTSGAGFGARDVPLLGGGPRGRGAGGGCAPLVDPGHRRAVRAGEPARRDAGRRGDRRRARRVPGVEPHDLRRARGGSSTGCARRSSPTRTSSRALIEREQGKPAAEARVAEVLPSLDAPAAPLASTPRTCCATTPLEARAAPARAQAGAARLRADRRRPRDQALELPVGAGAARSSARPSSPGTPSCSSPRRPRRSSACASARSPARRASRTGVVNVVAVDDAVAAALVEDPRVGKIVFTGSVATGQEGDGRGREEPHAGRPRAGRQGPGDRLPRRRPRPRRARHRLGRLHERRPDLRLGRARLRRAAGGRARSWRRCSTRRGRCGLERPRRGRRSRSAR